METTAFIIHRGAHLARRSARCVLHTHMPYATAVGMTETGFQSDISQSALLFHNRTARLDYGGLASAAEEGARIGAAIGDDVTAVMLENHGVLVIGSDVADAWMKLYFLERACEIQVLAQSTGQPLIRVSPEVAAETGAQGGDLGEAPALLFASVRRRVDRENPGYA